MKKVLIIASCGLIVAMIIGATSTSKSETPKTQEFNKCHDVVLDDTLQCESTWQKDFYTEKFLRGVKHKIRVAYA